MGETYTSEQVAVANARLKDVVSDFGVVLKKNGPRFKGLCPFHNEKTPSFNVELEKGFYKCFGCGKGGDAISFVRETQSLGFIDAIEHISEKYNLGLIATTDEEAQIRFARKKIAQSMLEKTQEFFQESLREEYRRGSGIAKYLFGQDKEKKERNITTALAKEWGLGYAPSDPHALVSYLLENYFTLEDIFSQGLLNAKNDSTTEPNDFYSFFQARIMFPVYDHNNRIVGFSGRLVPLSHSGLSEDHFVYQQNAKYMNSRDAVQGVLTDGKDVKTLFSKGQLLYGMDKARQVINKTKRATLVEGNFDVISMHSLGFTDTVAPLGTAFTTQHAAYIASITDEVDVIYDGDSAGIKGAKATIPLLHKAGVVPYAVSLPQGLDPDSVRRDAPSPQVARQTLEQLLVADKKGIVNFFINSAGEITTSEQKSNLITEIFDAVWEEKPIRRAVYLQDAARKLDISAAVLAGEAGNRLQTQALPRDEYILNTDATFGDTRFGYIASLLFSDPTQLNLLLKQVPLDNPLMTPLQKTWYSAIMEESLQTHSPLHGALAKRPNLHPEVYISRTHAAQGLVKLAEIAVNIKKIIPNELLRYLCGTTRLNPTQLRDRFLQEIHEHEKNQTMIKLDAAIMSGNLEAIVEQRKNVEGLWI